LVETARGEEGDSTGTIGFPGHARETSGAPVTGEALVYIGVGTIVVILIIVLICFLLRRA